MTFAEKLAQERVRWNAGKWLASLPFMPFFATGWILGLLARLVLRIIADLRAALALGYRAGRG